MLENEQRKAVKTRLSRKQRSAETDPDEALLEAVTILLIKYSLYTAEDIAQVDALLNSHLGARCSS